MLGNCREMIVLALGIIRVSPPTTNPPASLPLIVPLLCPLHFTIYALRGVYRSITASVFGHNLNFPDYVHAHPMFLFPSVSSVKDIYNTCIYIRVCVCVCVCMLGG